MLRLLSSLLNSFSNRHEDKFVKINKKTKRVLLLIVLLVVLAPNFVRAYTINGPSMAPTFWFHDKVISLQTAYDIRIPYTDVVLCQVNDPDRSDLVIYFDIPKNHIAAKRVIGLPGDTIELKENVLYVNGTAADQTVLPRNEYEKVPSENDLGELVVKETLESNTHLVTYTPQASKTSNFGPVVVPSDQYFFLGDNRDRSRDSRYIGFITRDQIKGRIIYGARTID